MNRADSPKLIEEITMIATNKRLRNNFIGLEYVGDVHYKVVCHCCDGTGFLDYPDGSGHMSCPYCFNGIEELNQSLTSKTTQVCPDCHRVLAYTEHFIVWTGHGEDTRGRQMPYCKHCNKLELAFWYDADRLNIIDAFNKGASSVIV